jgi:hypothetical protein
MATADAFCVAIVPNGVPLVLVQVITPSDVAVQSPEICENAVRTNAVVEINVELSLPDGVVAVVPDGSAVEQENTPKRSYAMHPDAPPDMSVEPTVIEPKPPAGETDVPLTTR